jgi:hypothetical protein
MALVTVNYAVLGDNEATIDYVYDDVSHILQSATLTNNGTRNALTMILRDPTTKAIIQQFSKSFGQGSQTFNLAPQNISLVFNAAKNRWNLPFIVETTWA